MNIAFNKRLLYGVGLLALTFGITLISPRSLFGTTVSLDQYAVLLYARSGVIMLLLLGAMYLCSSALRAIGSTSKTQQWMAIIAICFTAAFLFMVVAGVLFRPQ